MGLNLRPILEENGWNKADEIWPSSNVLLADGFESLGFDK